MTSLDRALERIDQLIKLRMQQFNLPGWAIAVTDREKPLWTSTYGFASAQLPVLPDSLFEIGSIGKSFTCIALLQLQEEGKLDLHAPVARYLPWFQVRSRYSSITPHHLMRHTSGIIRGTVEEPYGLYDCWALREIEASAPPGERWHYSSVGYKVLGFLLEELTGQPYPEVIKSRVLEPLGMTQTQPAITFESRQISTVGYRCFYDDRPEHCSHGIAPALWSEYATGDGCQVSTIGDLAKYLRMFLNRGRTSQGRLLSEDGFNALTRPVLSAGNDYYAYALALYPVDGHTYIGHGGATTGYMCCIMADIEDGLGVVSLVNKMGETDSVETSTIYAVTALRAALHQREIPPLPQQNDSTIVANASDYSGAFRCGGKLLQLAAEGQKLLLHYGGHPITLEQRNEDVFYVNHPDFHLFLLEFKREQGRVVEAFHGGDWYVNDQYSGPGRFDYPREWDAYPGHYRARNPELSNFRVVLRKGALALILPWCLVEPLTPKDDGSFRIGEDPRSPETLRFDSIAEGRALRASFSGCPYYRTFTP